MRADRQEVIVVAAHGSRRSADTMHFEAFQRTDIPREEKCLYFLSDGEFALDPLLFFLLDDQLLERLGHGVERALQRRELIVACDMNAMCELPGLDVLSRPVELPDG